MNKTLFSLALVCIMSLSLNAQKWTTMMNDTNANFYDIVKEFDNYWKDKPYEKGKGYKAFKRWQWFMEPRVYPSGNMKFASRTYALEEYNKYLNENPKKLNSSSVNAVTANWTALGPFGSPVNGDAGRVQVIRMHPTNANTFYVGAAAGGFWITNNNGVTYTTTTDQLGSCGVSDIAVDPINPNNIYISTGDRDAGDTYATGVLKSADGGMTWNNTGLVWQTSQMRRIHRLLINPQNPNTLILASSVGVYRSLNAGVTWNQVATGNYVDAEYRPGDTTTVYVVTTGGFSRSTNGGASFSSIQIASGMSVNRLAIAVTPANNNYVYILASATNNGFGGLYRSVNSGATFSLMSSSPNIFDWSTTGGGAGGQGWYDLAIDASPTNANEIIAGGVNSWRSTNGGATWSLNSHWTGSGGRPYVHADLHFVLYTSGSTCFLGTDGGVARSTNNMVSWSTINGNMNIAQIYKMGISSNNPNRIITGHQDNGSNLYNGANWAQVFGGDGMDCFIDWNNNNTIVVSTQNGGFRRSTNGGSSWSSITAGLSGTPGWVAPIVQDPVSPNTYYCGYQRVFKSTNQGTTWTPLGNIGSVLNEIKVAPSNTNIIYATSSGGVWKSTNGGTSWTNVIGTITGGSVTDLAIDNLNANNIYVTVSGFSSGNKVFASNNGGGTWTNYSTGLPNAPANCILFVKNSPQGLYVGTDIGVFYREGSMNAWIPFNSGLPNIPVEDLELYYPTGKLRAATYARGVWETDMYSDPLSAPYAAYGTAFTPGCINLPLQFNDLSANSPSAWAWSFPGGNPSSSNAQTPSITYTAPGIYTVNLTSSNANGTSPMFSSTIQVVGSPTASPVSVSVCAGDNANISVNTNAAIVNWSNGSQGFSTIVSNSVNTVYTYTASLGACETVGSATLFVDPVPDKPVVIPFSGGLTTTVAAQTYQWFLNGSSIPGAVYSNYFPTQTGYYSVWVAHGNCSSSSSSYHYIMDNSVGIRSFDLSSTTVKLSPNPVNEELFVEFSQVPTKELLIEIINNLGQAVQSLKLKTEKPGIRISTQGLSSGIYYLNVSHEGEHSVHKLIKQ
jgi:PKD repeat protein